MRSELSGATSTGKAEALWNYGSLNLSYFTQPDRRQQDLVKHKGKLNLRQLCHENNQFYCLFMIIVVLKANRQGFIRYGYVLI